MSYWKNYFIRAILLLAVLFFTFLCAVILSILPLPYKLKWLMPNWPVLVLIYWIIFVPQLIGLLFTFTLGVLIDLLMGNLLGLTSICFIPTAFLADYVCYRFRAFSISQQFLMIIVLVSVNHLIRLWLQLYINHPTNDLSYWLTIPSSIIAWPLVCVLLNLLRKTIRFC